MNELAFCISPCFSVFFFKFVVSIFSTQKGWAVGIESSGKRNELKMKTITGQNNNNNKNMAQNVKKIVYLISMVVVSFHSFWTTIETRYG